MVKYSVTGIKFNHVIRIGLGYCCDSDYYNLRCRSGRQCTFDICVTSYCIINHLIIFTMEEEEPATVATEEDGSVATVDSNCQLLMVICRC
jgi:hypothetical protein